MLILKKIILQNFMSIGNMPIEIDLYNYNKTLVTGANGSGKSTTLLDSVVFALYGTAYRNINKNQLINSINESGLLVEICFSILDKNYRVVRGLSPTIFDIYVDGVKLNELSSVKEQQKYLEENILKINYLTFSNIAILGSANYVPFMDQPLAIRRTLIEELLDINLFAQMLIVAKEHNKEVLDDIKSSQYEVRSILEQIKLLEKFIITINTPVTVINNDSKILEIKETINALNLELEKISNSKKLYQQKLKEIKDPQLDLDKLQNFVADYTAQLRTENKKIKFYDSNDNCPTCFQSINIAFKDDCLGKSKNLIENLSDRILKANSLIHSKNNIKCIIKTYNDDLNVLSYEYKKISDNIQYHNRQLKDLSTKNGVVPILETNSADYENQLSDLKNNLREYYNKIEKLQLEKDDYDLVIKILSDNGIKSKILEKYLPYFNSYINSYLSVFDLELIFEFNSTFKEVIKSRYKNGFTYNSFSEGEKMKISLAIMLAFRDLASLKSTNSTNLLIMDEIFDSSLDNDSNINLMSILNNMSDNNVFIISHRNDIDSESFNRSMIFSKYKDFTKIDYT